MNTHVSLSPQVTMTIEQAPRCLTLTPTLDGARLQLAVRAWTNVPPQPPASGLDLSASVYVGPSTMYTQRFDLCEVTAENLFTPSVTASQVTLVGRVTGDALRAVEDVRAGGPLHVVLGLPRVTWVAGDPPTRTQVVASDLVFELFADEWATQLEKVTAASYVDVMIPITSDHNLQVAAGHIRTARKHISDIGGDNLSAVAGELRQALESVRSAYRLSDQEMKVAREKSTRERTPAERWALLIEARFSWLSAFVHDDDEAIKGCTMGRAEANEALASVAGMVQRLAADRRAGLI